MSVTPGRDTGPAEYGMLHLSVRNNIWRYNISVKFLSLPGIARVIAIRYVSVDVFETFVDSGKLSTSTDNIVANVDVVVFLRPNIPLVKGSL